MFFRDSDDGVFEKLTAAKNENDKLIAKIIEFQQKIKILEEENEELKRQLNCSNNVGRHVG